MTYINSYHSNLFPNSKGSADPDESLTAKKRQLAKQFLFRALSSDPNPSHRKFLNSMLLLSLSTKEHFESALLDFTKFQDCVNSDLEKADFSNFRLLHQKIRSLRKALSSIVRIKGQVKESFIAEKLKPSFTIQLIFWQKLSEMMAAYHQSGQLTPDFMLFFRQVDSLLLTNVLLICNSTFIDPDCELLTKKMLDRASSLGTFLTLEASEALKESAGRNLVSIHKLFARLIERAPAIFGSFIDKFFEVSLVHLLTDFKNRRVFFSVSFLVQKIVHCFLYTSPPDDINTKMILKKQHIQRETKVRCFEEYNLKFGNDDVLVAILKRLIKHGFHSEDGEQHSEDESNIFEMTADSSEATQPKLSNIILEKLLWDFPIKLMNIMNASINSVISGKVSLTVEEVDSLFSILRYFPKAYERQVTTPEQSLQIEQILNYLCHRVTENELFLRRALLLIQSWNSMIEAPLMPAITNLLLSSFQHESFVIKFQAINCTQKLLQPAIKIDQAVISACFPVFADILNRDTHDWHILRMSMFFKSLLDYLDSEVSNEQLLQTLKSINLPLVLSKSDTHKSSIIEITRSLVERKDRLQVPEVLDVVIEFAISILESESRDRLEHSMKLILVVSRAIPDNMLTLPSLGRLFSSAKKVMESHLLTQLEEELTPAIINVIEEFLLMGAKPEHFNIPSSFTQLYTKAKATQHFIFCAICVQLYCCLMTLLLQSIDLGFYSIGLFEEAIQIAVEQITASFEEATEIANILKKESLMFLSRLLIHDFAGTIAVVEKLISLPDFFNSFLTSAKNFPPEIVQKLSVICMLHCLQRLPMEQSITFFEPILTEISPEIEKFASSDRFKIPTLKRTSEKVSAASSHRRDALRLRLLLPTQNITDLARETIEIIAKRAQEVGVELPYAAQLRSKQVFLDSRFN